MVFRYIEDYEAYEILEPIKYKMFLFDLIDLVLKVIDVF